MEHINIEHIYNNRICYKTLWSLFAIAYIYLLAIGFKNLRYVLVYPFSCIPLWIIILLMTSVLIFTGIWIWLVK